MTVIKRGAEGRRNLVVGAQVPHVRQATIGIAGTARIAKSLGLKRATARIPKIGGACQPQRMYLAGQSKLRSRTQTHAAVPVLVIHHVVEGEARVLAWGSQHLKESPVTRVTGVPVAAPV